MQSTRACEHASALNISNMLIAPNLCKNILSLLDVIKKCKSISELKQIHALVVTLGLSQDDALVSELINVSALSDPSVTDYSYQVLSSLSNPRIFHWNTVIRGYSQGKNPNKSISAFLDMLGSGLSPDHLTYPFLIKASARLLKKELGGSIHSHVLRNGYAFDIFVMNSLIHMYGSCGEIDCAREIFDEIPVRNIVTWNSIISGYAKFGNMCSARDLFDVMPERDVVSWSSLIDGYVKSGEYGDAMALFEKMLVMGPKANEVTMVSVLCACAHLGALDKGKLVHQYIIDNRLPLTLTLRTSLVDMYAKCGAINEALTVFRGFPNRKSDVLMWNTMIGGLAGHGLFRESLDLFEEMQNVGVKPDEITYLCLLSACAHGGLVKEAWHFFKCLGEPKREHYACMVDAMARAGQLEEAYKFLGQMPNEPTASTLGALLSGCINHKKLDWAEVVGKKLIELDPDHDGRYVGLSNIYAVFRRWDEARSMRELMERRGVKKSPGYSYLEMSGALHRFIAHDQLHPSTEQIYVMLSLVVSQMKVDASCECEEHDWNNVEGT